MTHPASYFTHLIPTAQRSFSSQPSSCCLPVCLLIVYLPAAGRQQTVRRLICLRFLEGWKMVVSDYPSVLALESPSLTGSEQRPTLTEVFVFTRSTRSAINVDALSYGAEMCTRLTVQFKVGVYALGKAHMRSTRYLRKFPRRCI